LTKDSSTDFLTLDDLQSDILLQLEKRIGEFLLPSLSPLPFLDTSVALRNALGKEEKRKAVADDE